MAGQVYFVQRNNIRMVFYLVIQVYGEEDGNADVGDTGAVPVNFCSRKGGVVLTGRNDDAHEQGQQGAEGEEGRSVGQFL